MSETQTVADVSNRFETPLGFGIGFGLVLGIIERFLLHFDLPTLAVAFVVVVVVLARFGDHSSVDVGRALAAVGVASYVVLRTLVLVFG